jgi:hypothetical protein
MAEELGRIEKPPVEGFKKGRKLFFVPLLYKGEEPPEEYLEKYNRYWEQVAKQLAELESKLGKIKRIYHELIPVSGQDGSQILEKLNENSYKVVQGCLNGGAQMEAAEDSDLITEFMDWSRCLIVGLQNEKVFKIVYDAYTEVGKKRNEFISRKIEETLKADEIGIFFMRDNHQVQFPPDIQVFYVSPPALDDIKRWLRDRQEKTEIKPESDKA